MPVFDQLQRAAFAGIEFPIRSCEVTGSIRDHIHIYPHAKGGAPEKLGRNLYLVRMEANFQSTFWKYPANLWPLKLRELRGIFEDQTTDDLVIPTIGTIKAYCRNWSQKMEARIRSGEICNFEFVEDQDATKLEQELQSVSFASFERTFGAFEGLVEFYKDEKTESIFDAISNIGNFLLSFGDLAEVAGNLVSAKIMAMADLLQQFDRSDIADNPRNEPLIAALANLHDTVLKIVDDQRARLRTIEFYQVRSPMSMSQISQTLYGTTDRAIELMQMNAVPDAFRVEPGTVIRFYPPQG